MEVEACQDERSTLKINAEWTKGERLVREGTAKL
jgi:hypothetical protein